MFLFIFFMHILGCVGTLVCVVPLDLNLFQQLLMLNTCPSGTCNRTRTRINLKIHVLHVQFILKHFFNPTSEMSGCSDCSRGSVRLYRTSCTWSPTDRKKSNSRMLQCAPRWKKKHTEM